MASPHAGQASIDSAPSAGLQAGVPWGSDPGTGRAAAKELQADVLQQWGYQAESGPWRNFYLTGAKELREGVKKLPVPGIASPDTIKAMSLYLFFDYLGMRLNGPKAAGKKITLNLDFTDTNGEIRSGPEEWCPEPQAQTPGPGS